MQIKKHKLSVNTSRAGQMPSSFIVDLRQEEKAEKKIETPAPAALPEPVSIPTPAPTGTFRHWLEKGLKEDKEDAKQLLFYPVARAIYRGFYRLIKFFKKAKKEVKRRMLSVNYYSRSLAEDLKREELAVERALKRPPSRVRRILFFALLLLLLILPFKVLVYYRLINLDSFRDRVYGSVDSAWQNLSSGGTAASERRFTAANQSFAAAGSDFIQIQSDLKQVDELMLGLASRSSDPKLRLASASPDIAAAGAAASDLGQDLSLALGGLFASSTDKQFGTMLDRFTKAGNWAVDDSRRLNESLAKIDPGAVPASYQSQFQSLKEQGRVMQKGLENFMDLAVSLKDFLGANETKRYLLVFQNNSELRASGGFIGSYALVDIEDGKIKKLEVPAGGSYDTRAGLRVLVKAPAPLQLVDPLWHFWDANWWSNWPDSARNLEWFYEKSDGPTVDGVIAITPTVMEKLLTITGPIDMTADYGYVVTSDNFWEKTQTLIETTGNPALYASSTEILKTAMISTSTATSSDATKPKKIIGDLFNRILERLPQVLTPDNFPKVLAALESSLSEKQLMFYFNDPDLQAKIIARGWGGDIAPTSGDYLSVVNTNIAGAKTDRKIIQTINHQAQVQADGSIVDTVTITRAHSGAKGELFTGVRNVDWLRVYVPLGSQLLSASGFRVPDAKYFETPDSKWQDNDLVATTEGRATTDPASGAKIYQENHKTVFAGWSMVDPGDTVQLQFQYRLPFKFGDLRPDQTLTTTGSWWQDLWEKFLRSVRGKTPDLTYYSLLVQKQPGAASSTLAVDFGGVPAVWQPIMQYPSATATLSSNLEENTGLDQDYLWMKLYSNNSGSK